MKEVRIVRVRYRFQFLLGHVSVQTTERYLGCKQRIRSAVNDRMASSRILELSWVMSCGRVADNPFTI
jgi:hypothetical protein